MDLKVIFIDFHQKKNFFSVHTHLVDVVLVLLQLLLLLAPAVLAPRLHPHSQAPAPRQPLQQATFFGGKRRFGGKLRQPGAALWP
jgi:hypothetical protein